MSEASVERRKNPRFPVHVPIQLRCGAQILPGMLHDICRDACLIELRQALDLGSHVSIVVELPGTGGPLEVGGRVVRVAPGGEPSTNDVAVLFSHLTPAAETRIDFFIALQTS
jgi:hypothetical protein